MDTSANSDELDGVEWQGVEWEGTPHYSQVIVTSTINSLIQEMLRRMLTRTSMSMSKAQ